MLITYRSIAFLSLVTSISCGPIYSVKNFFGCSTHVQQELNIAQGLHPTLKNPTSFGYIYSIENPTVNMASDIPIFQASGSGSNVSAVLSEVTYDQRTSKLVMRGRISGANADRLKQGSLDSLNVKFGTFALNKATQQWKPSFGDDSRGVTGKVVKSNIVHQVNGNDAYHEMILELIPSTEKEQQQTVEHLQYNPVGRPMRLEWNDACKKTARTSRRDRFNEVVESTVLL